MTTKQDIFDLFYGKKMKGRAGGGTLKSKMTRLSPSHDDMENMKKSIRKLDDPYMVNKLLEYFNKLHGRKPEIAPPPRPTN